MRGKNMKKIIYLILLLTLTFVMVGCKTTSDNSEEIDNNNPTNITEDTSVKLGIDLIDDNMALFENKRVGLITNATGINSEWESTIDVLNNKVNLVALFAPEHGIRGGDDGGTYVSNTTDSLTGLPIYSLYGTNYKPTEAMMSKIDVLCIDIQDVGARFYTFITTMSYAMDACSEYNKKFVVFDRPNPIGGVSVEGNSIDTDCLSFVGRFPIPQRHGMTMGELAELFNNEYLDEKCDLTVIEMENWTRDMYFDETGCPWVLASPNMPTLDTAIVYPGTCIFGDTNLSFGKGTTRPFELIGAPWMDSIETADALNDLSLPGVYFRPAAFTPSTSTNSGEVCFGVQVHVLDRKTFNSVKTGWAMLKVIRDMYPTDCQVYERALYVAGCHYIYEDTYSLDQLYNILDNESVAFSKLRQPYLLYDVA